MNASQKWATIFRQLGYDVGVRSDADLIFTDDGVPFVVMVEEQDSTYLHIILPGVAKDLDRSEDVRERAARIVNDVNANTKISKLIISATGVFASVEAICPTTAAAAKIIPALLSHAKLAGFRFD